MKSIKIGYNHEIIKYYMKIKTGSRDHIKSFAVEGTWAYEKIIQTDIAIEAIIVCIDHLSNFEEEVFLKLSCKSKIVYEVSSKTMNRINSKDNASILMICKHNNKNVNPNKVIILDGLENPGNIGTIFRTADGAGYDAVFIVNQLAKVNQYKIVKASMGGFFSTPYRIFDSIEDCIKTIKALNLSLYLAHPGQKSKLSKSSQVALVVGNERYGLSKQWFRYDHHCISIPMLGCCDSLNVGVAASILMYEIGIQ